MSATSEVALGVREADGASPWRAQVGPALSPPERGAAVSPLGLPSLPLNLPAGGKGHQADLGSPALGEVGSWFLRRGRRA